MLGKLVGKAERPVDDGVVSVGHAIGGVGVGQVGDRQQQVAELGTDGVVLGRELLLPLAESPALGRQRLSRRFVALTTQPSDVLGELVDPGAGGVALSSDVAQAGVELGG